MTPHVCLGAPDPDNLCLECFCMYCYAPLMDGLTGRCSDANCENHWRRPTSLNRFGGRNR